MAGPATWPTAADLAAVCDAFTRLAEATGEARWIGHAIDAADALHAGFADPAGGYYTTGDDAEALITRPKDVTDNATPSANSLAALALVRLAALTGRADLRDRAVATVRASAPLAVSHPSAFGHLLWALELLHDGSTEIAVVGDEPELLSVARRAFLPTAVLTWGEPYDSPLWEGRRAGHAYVCRDHVCDAPVTEPGRAARAAGGVRCGGARRSEGGGVVNVEAILNRKGHEVATIGPEATIREAVEALAERRIGALVVSEDGEHIAGIISERDIVRGLADAGTDLLDARVSALMTTAVQTCQLRDTVPSSCR